MTGWVGQSSGRLSSLGVGQCVPTTGRPAAKRAGLPRQTHQQPAGAPLHLPRPDECGRPSQRSPNVTHVSLSGPPRLSRRRSRRGRRCAAERSGVERACRRGTIQNVGCERPR
jgi:hypothetical protein